MTWLVVGCAGQLGRDVMAALAAAGIPAAGLDRPDIDITDPRCVEAALADHRPDVVVNCAAYTAVDDAEGNRELADAVNGDGAGIIARAVARTAGTRLIHLSTDYVFSGSAHEPYAEDARPAPASVYGRSKLLGEQQVRAALPDRSFVVRTAWLYGAHGSNFVATMLRLAAQRDTLAVVTDQIGQPTWSGDLAARLVDLGNSAAPAGIYHGTNSGCCSWYEFARRIFRLCGLDPDRVRPTTSADFPRPAPRPAYSVLGHDRWAAAGLPPMRNWREAAAEGVPAVAAALTAPASN